MATIERVEKDVVCDRPGCGKRVTEKGGLVMLSDGHLLFLERPECTEEMHGIDLCRECLQQIGNAWNRKAGDE